MKNYFKIIHLIFGLPWIVFGVQHFMYAEFVAGLVPEFIPLKLFWAYFTGTAMLAAGLAIIFNKLGFWAAIMLSAMLGSFVLLIHVPALASQKLTAASWTRPLQDVALAAAALMLAETFKRNSQKTGLPTDVLKTARIIFAMMLIGFGAQQFFDLDFMTARTPAFFPLHWLWIYLTGTLMIISGLCIFIGRKVRQAAWILGGYLLIINVLNYGHLLISDLHDPRLWTAAMLDLAITGGVFLVAISSIEE